MINRFFARCSRYVFILFISFYASIVFADTQAIGQIIWAKGDVHAVGVDKTTRALQRGSAVYQEDTVQTSNTGTGEIAFTDGSLLSLRSATNIVLSQYKHGNGNPPAQDSFVVNVVKGGFRTVTGAISKNNPQGYEVSTPLGTIGVHGTIYDVFYNATIAKLSLAISQGSIRIVPQKGEAVVLSQGTANIGATITATQIRVLNTKPPEVSAAPKIVPVKITVEPAPAGSNGKNIIKVSPCP